MRADLALIASRVRAGSRVLDLGCGDGSLLAHLIAERGCSGHGVEISDEGVLACIAAGVPVEQGDIDDGLDELAADSFDLVVLSQTLQTTHRPAAVLDAMLRVAPTGVVSIPNFAHWRLRAGLALGGRMPSSRALPATWYGTPNIHLCTLADFEELAAARGATVIERILLDEQGAQYRLPIVSLRPNVLAAGAVYRLARAA